MRFYIAVHQPGAMGIAHARACLDHERDALFDGESTALADELFQVLAGDLLHDDVDQIVGDAKIMHGDDVGMRKIRCRPRLEQELFLKVIVRGIFLAQDFDGDGTVEHDIARKVDVRHAACAKRLL